MYLVQCKDISARKRGRGDQPYKKPTPARRKVQRCDAAPVAAERSQQRGPVDAVDEDGGRGPGTAHRKALRVSVKRDLRQRLDQLGDDTSHNGERRAAQGGDGRVEAPRQKPRE